MSLTRTSRIIIHPLHGPRWADDRVTDAFADELVSLLTQLVVIDSVNPSLVPGGAGEAELARFVANWFKRHGIEATLEDVATGRPNVRLTLPSSPSQPRLRSQPVIRDSLGSILRPAGSLPMARDSKKEWTRSSRWASSWAPLRP